MKKHDNLFEQFKKASKVQEAHDFPGMEKVWSRVDAKLDTEIFNTQQKTNLNWKKYTVAATVFIGTIFTFQLIQQSNFNHSIANTIVKVTKEKLNKSLLTDTTPVVLNKAPLIKKKEIKKIFLQQLQSTTPVAFNNQSVLQIDSIASKMASIRANVEVARDLSKAQSYEAISSTHSSIEESDYKKEEVKADPLIIIDGKITNKKIFEIENANDLETILELKEPLYIINDKEYSEKELFGPNATSPYFPLKKQVIETISIYKDEEAIDLYGKKGEKGVIVIKTKNGKPVMKL